MRSAGPKRHESIQARHNPIKYKNKPPKGMHLDSQDLHTMVTGSVAETETVLKSLDADIIALKRQVRPLWVWWQYNWNADTNIVQHTAFLCWSVFGIHCRVLNQLFIYSITPVLVRLLYSFLLMPFFFVVAFGLFLALLLIIPSVIRFALDPASVSFRVLKTEMGSESNWQLCFNVGKVFAIDSL